MVLQYYIATYTLFVWDAPYILIYLSCFNIVPFGDSITFVTTYLLIVHTTYHHANLGGRYDKKDYLDNSYFGVYKKEEALCAVFKVHI